MSQRTADESKWERFSAFFSQTLEWDKYFLQQTTHSLSYNTTDLNTNKIEKVGIRSIIFGQSIIVYIKAMETMHWMVKNNTIEKSIEFLFLVNFVSHSVENYDHQ